MSNSPLVTYTALSPNCSKRTGGVSKITIHHTGGGPMSAEAIGRCFGAGTNKSANYGVGNDGSIGLYVPEDKRAWTSNSRVNDNMAVTIEVSNSEARYPWPVSDAAYRALIALCVDICWRNGIERLNYTGDTSGNLTRHNMFAATACPGPYLQERFPAIAAEVNERLEELRMPRYNTIEAVPAYAKDTIKKLCDQGIIKGQGGGCDTEGYPADMNLSEDMLRLLVWNDRAGVYDDPLERVMATK